MHDPLESGSTEFRACLASLEDLIERTRLLDGEYDPNGGPAAKDLKHAISFSEVRNLDLLCKRALERFLPSHPELAENWYVHGHSDRDSPEDLHSDLVAKRAVLTHARHLSESPAAAQTEEAELDPPPQRAERPRPTLVGHIGFVPRGLGTIADIGGGVAVIILVVSWLTGLL